MIDERPRFPVLADNVAAGDDEFDVCVLLNQLVNLSASANKETFLFGTHYVNILAQEQVQVNSRLYVYLFRHIHLL